MNINLVDQLCFDNDIIPFYKNILRNTLTGTEICVNYSQNFPENFKDLYVVADVPDFLEIYVQQNTENIELKRIPQYRGYAIDLTKYSDVNELFARTLSRNPRKNFRAKRRRLEHNHQISYKFYYGNIEKYHYDYLFEVCYDLMKTRFIQKKIHNRYLLNWKYYHKLFYPKILSKEASLCVVYDKTKPITLTLNFHLSDVVFSFIQIYDTDYYRFSMGDIAMFKNLEWSYENNFSVWDMSKGETPNKLRWSNHTYLFEYHLLYNSVDIKILPLRFYISQKLRLKQFLRDKGIIGGMFQFDRLYFYTNKKKLKNHDWRNQ